MTALLENDPPPDAVFAASDMQALGAMRAAQAADLRVPDDLAIVGFDDIELSRCAGMTTLRQPARSMGTRAAENLLRRIATSGGGAVSSTVFSPELVVRQTCGARDESPDSPTGRLPNRSS
jgi:LacI family transcriptional regulator